MLFNLIVLLLIVLITAYLATQGMLSSLLALATVIFASVLAMGLLEPLQGIIGGWRPEYARGVTFLLLFFLAFSGTRIAADRAVPKNIKLPMLVNRVAGGIVGFFAALVVVGNMIIGIEMLPVGRTVMMFDRFPDANNMQALEPDGRSSLGKLAPTANVWLAPDRFVLAIWNGTSGRALGGARPWASVHPDLSVESYGYRNQIDGSRRYVPADLVNVQDAWMSADVKLKDETGSDRQAEPGKRLVMIRTEVNRGGPAPHLSSDDDNYFRISASQVRLVTDKGRQYYPIGYMEQGRVFTPLSLDSGYVLDDYMAKTSSVVDDWIFQVAEDEKPDLLELKELGRIDNLAGRLKDKPGALAANYPHHDYLKDVGNLTVYFDPGKVRTLRAGNVYVLKNDSVRRDAIDLINPAYAHILAADKAMGDGTGGWGNTAGKPGVPTLGQFSSAERFGQNIKNDADDAPLVWSMTIQLLLLGQMEPDGELNWQRAPSFFDSEIIRAWKNTRRGNLIIGAGSADLSLGKVEIKRIPFGVHPVVVTMLTDRSYFVWVKDMTFGEDKKDGKGQPMKDKDGKPIKITDLQMNVSVDTSKGEVPIFSVDLEPKTP